MKIVRLEAENIKRLIAVEITPDGNLVELCGKNGSGKTSILDSISWAIEGAKHIQSQPIRHGQTEARIRLDLGEVIVTRKFWTRDDGTPGTSVVVEAAENGAVFKTPQNLLNSFLDALSFDPLQFARMAPKDQFSALRKFVPDADFDEIDGLNARDFNERTGWNKRAKEAIAAARSIQLPNVAPVPIDDSALVEELEKAGQHNAKIETIKANRGREELRLQQINAAIKHRKSHVEQLRAQAKAILEEALAEEHEVSQDFAKATQLEADLKGAGPLPEAIDTTAIKEQIAKSKATNQTYQTWKQAAEKKNEHLAKHKESEAKADELSEAIKARTAAKEEAIAAASLPVPGLGFGEGFIMLNGVPFEQGSDAEQLRASIGIAMAGDPKLRVIRIRDGSLLDAEGLQLVAEMADEHDCQVWIERVQQGGPVGFEISEGRVVAHHKAEVAEEE